MAKIYTRTGDDGRTGLFSGQRVDKDALRVDAYGTVDELNSAIGFAAVACDDASMLSTLRDIQKRLFDIGARLCTTDQEMAAKLPAVDQSAIEAIERNIDAVSEPLPELKQFILPGGSELAARLHLARTVCRRAERCIVSLGHNEAVDPTLIRYTNRLSDLLFAMARRANQLAGLDDVPWKDAETSD